MAVSRERFIKVWQSSSTAVEAARKLNMMTATAVMRAHRYRAAGHRVKKMKRGPAIGTCGRLP